MFTKLVLCREQDWCEVRGAWGHTEKAFLKGNLGRCVKEKSQERRTGQQANTIVRSIETKTDQHPSIFQSGGYKSRCGTGKEKS